VKTAKEVGAISLHAAMTQRRYEEFNDFATFKASFENNQKCIAMAEPILRKYQMRLAWRITRLAFRRAGRLVEAAGQRIRGVHLDFGNNVSLCEDPPTH